MKKILLILFLLVSNISNAYFKNTPQGIQVCDNCVVGRSAGYKTAKEAYAAAELDGYIQITKELLDSKQYDSYLVQAHKNYKNVDAEYRNSFKDRFWSVNIIEQNVYCARDPDDKFRAFCWIIYEYPSKKSNAYKMIKNITKNEGNIDISGGEFHDMSNLPKVKRPDQDSIWKKLK